ncbi:MAG: hypothetical protein WBQ20_03530 [Methyloceanibacter sp.]|jgi:hypothetical protein
MNLLCRLLTADAAICALTLLGFYGQADAATRLMLKASLSPTILAADEENPEVQNLLDPKATNGVPGGPSTATPGDEPKAGVEMKAMPEGGGEGETKEIDKEEGK